MARSLVEDTKDSRGRTAALPDRCLSVPSASGPSGGVNFRLPSIGGRPRRDRWPSLLAAFPEPYLGSLDRQRRPAGVLLALNLGQAHLDFQGDQGCSRRDQAFTDRIQHERRPGHTCANQGSRRRARTATTPPARIPADLDRAAGPSPLLPWSASNSRLGTAWFRLLEDGLRVVDRLGTGGRPIQPRYPVAPCRFSRARTALLSSPCARPQQSKGLKQL